MCLAMNGFDSPEVLFAPPPPTPGFVLVEVIVNDANEDSLAFACALAKSVALAMGGGERVWAGVLVGVVVMVLGEEPTRFGVTFGLGDF